MATPTAKQFMERARRLRLDLLDVVGCGIWVYDGQDTIYVNRELCQITGYEANELLHSGFFERLIHPDDHDMIVERGRARVRGEEVPERYEVRVLARDGEVRTLSIHARRLDLGEQVVSVVSAVDTTQLTDARRRIQDGTFVVRRLLDSLPAHIIATNPTGKPVFINSHWLMVTGQSMDEALERGTAPLIHPDDRERATTAWLNALKLRQGYDIDYRIRTASGDYRWQNFRIRPVDDASGTPVGWTSVSVDVHETKEFEREIQDANEELSDAVRAKDEVMAMIAHEVRSPLTTLVGNARVLKSRGLQLEPADHEALVDDLERDARRLSAVIDNMLVLSRQPALEDIEFEPVRLNLAAQRCIEDFQGYAPDRTVILQADPDLPLAEANPTYYNQVLYNLLSNAHKYSPPDRPIVVRLSNCGNSVETRIIDEGDGLPDDELPRIFNPFYRSRTHRNVGGIGLGLTVCMRLVELHGGRITVRNLPEGGCEFTFTTPAVEDLAID